MITDTDRINWLEAHPLPAKVMGGSDDGLTGKAWAVAAAQGTLREAVDLLMAQDVQVEGAMTWLDVTGQVDFGDADGESLPLTRCVCGATFHLWNEILSIYPERPWACPSCHARLYFANGIRVYKINENPAPS